MDAAKSLFVSYSGRSRADKMFAVRLLARLKQQGFDPWVYEQRGDEIAPGDLIDEACRKQIRKADVFVCIVSDSSLTSPSTAMEVQFAATVFSPGDIFQIVTTTQAQQAWPEPYCSLLPYKHVDATRMDDADLERVLLDLCRILSVRYTPPADAAPRLPLIRRLTLELQDARPARHGYESATYERMLGYAMAASNAYFEQRKEHAVSSIDTLVHELAREYPDHAFYYPRLLKAVLLLELTPARMHYLDTAQKGLEDIVGDARLADKLDENAYAALAIVALRRNAPQDALARYLEANAVVESRGQVDPDILHNIVVAYLATVGPRDELDIDALLEKALHGSVTSDPMLVERLTALRAAFMASRGDLDGAADCLRDVDCDNGMCMDILCRIAQELAANPVSKFRHSVTAPVERLFDVVVARGDKEQRNAALLSQAGFRYGRGRFDDALRALDAVDHTIACKTHIMLERALILINLGQTERAQQVLNDVVDSEIPFDRPPSFILESLYYRGFAAWLLNRRDEAMRDFRDSKFAEAYAYGVAAQRHLAVTMPDFALTPLPGRRRPRWLT